MKKPERPTSSLRPRTRGFYAHGSVVEAALSLPAILGQTMEPRANSHAGFHAFQTPDGDYLNEAEQATQDRLAPKSVSSPSYNRWQSGSLIGSLPPPGSHLFAAVYHAQQGSCGLLDCL